MCWDVILFWTICCCVILNRNIGIFKRCNFLLMCCQSKLPTVKVLTSTTFWKAAPLASACGLVTTYSQVMHDWQPEKWLSNVICGGCEKRLLQLSSGYCSHPSINGSIRSIIDFTSARTCCVNSFSHVFCFMHGMASEHECRYARSLTAPHSAHHLIHQVFPWSYKVQFHQKTYWTR